MAHVGKDHEDAISSDIQVGSGSILQHLMQIARASALAEMASGIAHELNQPLGAIAAFAQAGIRMLSQPEPMVGRALEVARQITAEALRAGEGIRHIRHMTEPGLPNRTRCQMPELVRELLPAFAALTRRVDSAVSVHAQEALPDLLVDRLRIQHVLYALTDNAIEASGLHRRPAGIPVRIDIRADHLWVETGVTDSGPGVSAADQPRLFRPFFTTKPKGTGLGLATSRAIVESHDGTIGFDNLPLGGSRFWFRLPRAAG